jgi:hypothetical protein
MRSWSGGLDVLLCHAVTPPNLISENYHHGAIDIISVTLFKNVWVFVQIINKMVLTWDRLISGSILSDANLGRLI